MNKDSQIVLWPWKRLMKKTYLLWSVKEYEGKKYFAFTPVGLALSVYFLENVN